MEIPRPPSLTIEQLRAMALTNRLMDSGELSYVVFRHERFPFPSDVLQHHGVVSGQGVDLVLLAALQAALGRQVVVEQTVEQIAEQFEGPAPEAPSP